MWLGNKEKVYILDKTENNPVTINGRYGTHPAWAVEYDIASNTCKSTSIDKVFRYRKDAADMTQIDQWMYCQTPFVHAVLNSVTVHGQSLVVTSVSPDLQTCLQHYRR